MRPVNSPHLDSTPRTSGIFGIGLEIYEGRMRRRDYAFAVFVVPILVIVLAIAILAVVQALSDTAAAVIGVIMYIAFIIYLSVVNARRCHDIGLTGWLQLVPFFGLVLLFKKGDDGPNQYGPDPLAETMEGYIADMEYRRPDATLDAELATLETRKLT